MSPLIALVSVLSIAAAEELEGAPVEDAPVEMPSEEVTTLALSTAPVGARTPTTATPDPIEQRLLSDEPVATAGTSPRASGVGSVWVWPLGLLGLAGLGGVAYRNRKIEGISNDIKVLSRTALNNKASLAVVEVADADGETRRMLVGVGGGAPRLVADLSAPASAVPPAAVPASVQAMVEEPEPAPPEGEADDAESIWGEWFQPRDNASESPTEADDVTSLKAEVVEEHRTTPKASPKVRRRARGAGAYAQEQEDADRQQRLQAREILLAQVLAEREREADVDESGSRKEAWARNFEALLGQHSGSR